MRGLVLWAVAVAVSSAACGRVGFGDDVTPTCAEAEADEACLELVMQLVTWDQARAACAAMPNTHLATIRGDAENARVAELAATIPYEPSQTNTNQRQRMWVGGNAPVDIAQWTWTSGEPFDWWNWRAGEPSPNEYCLIVLGSQAGAWDNRPCTEPYEAYLCERNPM